MSDSLNNTEKMFPFTHKNKKTVRNKHAFGKVKILKMPNMCFVILTYFSLFL